ncbi:tRNA adenosine(34) deaminase TadA [Agaribacterium haliotis]|uniref:tRNA adenosine(34) deaminase TadA n=1 Tax=Agaribacterium haliotis TaxID=2013869 RepID=UPI000BB55052|nr:tRNA adenosine(34) deaminase TadA [Agaribacterium haliotis]
MLEQDQRFMSRALELAKEAAELGEVPVGALVVRDGQILAEAGNRPISDCDASAHAEVLAIRKACRATKNYRLPGATLYVTIEPCAMCLGTLVHARIERLVYGAAEPKAGVVHSNTGLLQDACFNHQFSVEAGVMAEQCSEVISHFFKRRREQIKALKRASTACAQHRSPPG